jgi:hypothetical protein
MAEDLAQARGWAPANPQWAPRRQRELGGHSVAPWRLGRNTIVLGCHAHALSHAWHAHPHITATMGAAHISSEVRGVSKLGL